MVGRNLRLAMLCMWAATALGCAHARVVERHSNGGGVIAIPENTNSWPRRNRRRAEELMAKQCPAGYEIDHEQEVVVGTVTQTDTTTDRRGDPLLAAIRIAPVTEDVRQTTTHTDVREWRIWYRPKGAAPTASVPGNVIPVSATKPPGPAPRN